eukprot:4572247-Pleurochrysis_carterae.AAC.2
MALRLALSMVAAPCRRAGGQSKGRWSSTCIARGLQFGTSFTYRARNDHTRQITRAKSHGPCLHTFPRSVNGGVGAPFPPQPPMLSHLIELYKILDKTMFEHEASKAASLGFL